VTISGWIVTPIDFRRRSYSTLALPCECDNDVLRFWLLHDFTHPLSPQGRRCVLLAGGVAGGVQYRGSGGRKAPSEF